MTFKNYILSEERGNKILLKNFREYKIYGYIFFLAFLGFGILLIVSNLNKTDFSSPLFKNLWGVFLICLSPLFLLIFLPLRMKVIQNKDGFLIEKVNPFWIKKEFKIDKKENPTILGVKHRRIQSGGDGAIILLGNHLYEIKFFYNENKISLANNIRLSGQGSWNTPEEIQEISNFFKIPYKLISWRDERK